MAFGNQAAMAEMRSGGKSAPAVSTPKPKSSGPRWKRPGVHQEKAEGLASLPMPVIDPSIVKRSSRTHPAYGEGFGYACHLRVSSLKKAMTLMAGVAGVFAGAQFKPTREWLLGKLQPGQGPDEETRNKSSFRLTFVGEQGSDRVVTAVTGGDAGYTETSKCFQNADLC